MLISFLKMQSSAMGIYDSLDYTYPEIFMMKGLVVYEMSFISYWGLADGGDSITLTGTAIFW